MIHSLTDSIGLGQQLYRLAVELFPITRSITGHGVRETLRIISVLLPSLDIHEIDSGQTVFDWTIPLEWNIKEAYIAELDGTRVVDTSITNLHVVGYSHPVDTILSIEDLDSHLHSRPDLPNAIPYVTSYYRSSWGFCLSHFQRQALTQSHYKVKIDSTLSSGSLTYADLIVPGELTDEVLISTYTCHPSMGNNETSGMVVASFLAQYIQKTGKPRYTYRFVFVPETIGAVAYISKHLAHLKQNVIAGFVLTCVGDNRSYSFMPSREGNTLSDRVATHVLSRVFSVEYTKYSFLDRGSDERQYCSPGIDLPVVSLMRTKYGSYAEYHTSLDDLTLISPEGLYGGFAINKACLDCIEINRTYQSTVLCEPFLSKYGLYEELTNGIDYPIFTRRVSDILAYADGTTDLLAMAELFQCSIFELKPLADKLVDAGLLRPMP